MCEFSKGKVEKNLLISLQEFLLWKRIYNSFDENGQIISMTKRIMKRKLCHIKVIVMF